MRHPISAAFLTGDAIAAVARAAEDAGFESVWLTEHPAPPDRWLNGGGHDSLDPFVALSFAAAATTKLRLLTNLTVLPYRNPFLLAKAVATLDRLSGGRVTLGVGTGYLKGEYRALGVDFDGRNKLFDQSLEVMRAAWTGESVAGDHLGFSTRGTTSLPAPVQSPVPVWIGGNSRLTRRRVAAVAQGWMPMWNPVGHSTVTRTAPLETMSDLGALIAEVRAAALDAGRTDHLDMAITPHPSGSDTGDQLATISELADVGVDVAVIDLLQADELESFLARIGDYGRDVVAEMSRTAKMSTPSEHTTVVSAAADGAERGRSRLSGFDRFLAAAQSLGIDVAPVKYPQGTRTAVDAATAIGCDVSQIAKSLVLSAGEGVVLALTAGHHRVDLDKLSEVVGERVTMADADRARSTTGYAIGGTPPFGHATDMPVYLDPSLLDHATVYGAAGTPDTCFPIAPAQLVQATGAVAADFVTD